MSSNIKKRSPVVATLIYAVLVSYAVVVVYPMFWLLTTSLKSNQEIFLRPFSLPQLDDLHWENLANAWVKGHFGDYFLNSVVLTASTVGVVLMLASMAAYALARFTFPGVRPLFYYFLAGLMIPLQLAIVPLFFQMKAFGLLNSRFGLLVVYVAFAMPFSIFILTGFFKSLPASLHESALLDGAGEFRAFWHVMLPLARPGLITVGLFSFIHTWNEYFMAFMFLSGKDSEAARTLPLGIANIAIVSQYRSDWGMAFAGLTLMMLPMLAVYIVLQRHITKGLTVGALKG